MLPTIVVSASPIQARRDPGTAANLTEVLDESFSAVTTMTAEQIERQNGGALGNGGSIGNLLFDKPGITASTFAPGASRPVIRGLDNFRVRVQENGTSTLDVSEIGEDHAVPVDTLAADRVEVVRGPATLRYGSQAIGGVVSIDNNRNPTPATPFGFSGRIGGAFTAVDHGGEGSVAFDGRGKDVAMHLDAFARSAATIVFRAAYRLTRAYVRKAAPSAAARCSMAGSSASR